MTRNYLVRLDANVVNSNEVIGLNLSINNPKTAIKESAARGLDINGHRLDNIGSDKKSVLTSKRQQGKNQIAASIFAF